MVKALVYTIGNSPVIEKRGKHMVHSTQHIAGTANVEKGVLLAGK
ncbi:hypothetical protein BMS3Bbin11_00319 [bacterium BMS3Bbin11]|nr:hypothetical protein BMS3Bbin11_00319 [bacterium BMS3Bbin11]